MNVIFAQRALLATGWMEIAAGIIKSVEVGATPQPGDVRLSGQLPALSNLHSHSFQRAMAGMTEHRVTGKDSFCTWRALMYRFMKKLSPEQIEAIAAFAFMEMQEADFAAVGEFHSVHHQADGKSYANPRALSDRIFSAAQRTGIGLTHLPVLCSFGGADAKPLSADQQRFDNTVDQFAAPRESVRSRLPQLSPDTHVGVAPHSLRATRPEDLVAALGLAHGGPIHIHVAEQPQEVAEIYAWLGARPVDWLLHTTNVGPDWCAIHATHMTALETKDLARSGAVAGLCPITEANLGDGPFNGPGWLAAGGAYGIGSDSNVRISLAEELRTLEYSQRLRDIARNVLVVGEGAVGQSPDLGCAAGGAKALYRASGAIEPGLWADLMAIDLDHPTWCALPPEHILDGLIFAAPSHVVTDVWSAGRHQVKQGRHIHRTQIVQDWRRAVNTLVSNV